jgi:hypothetical protein
MTGIPDVRCQSVKLDRYDLYELKVKVKVKFALEQARKA